MKRINTCFPYMAWFMGLMLVSHCAFSAKSPVSVLQSTSNKMITSLKKNKATLKSNPKYVYSLVRRVLLPHVDITMMSRSVLGRSAWGTASKKERSEFVRSFTKTLIHTYSAAFASYTNETVKFLPIRGGYQGKKRVEVRTIIVRTNGPNIPVSYRLIARGSKWKVYDLTVEGVSLVQSFRSQFSNDLAKGGLKSLLAKMKSHNRK